MSKPRQPQQQTPEPSQGGGPTKKVFLPVGWKPLRSGGWEFYGGHPLAEEGVNIEWYVRPGEEHDWTVGFTFDADDDRPHLLNPIAVNDANGKPYYFWPDCAEDAQALLAQIGRYGFARPTADGWSRQATVTAADARTVIATDSDLHMMRRDVFGDWKFLDIAEVDADRIVAEMSELREGSIDVIYYAKYTEAPNGIRIDQGSVHVIRVSRASISSEELDEVRERSGLGWDMHTITITLPVPRDINDSELVAYATEQIRNQPPSDFLADVVDDDLAIDGTVYDSDVYSPDGEGGVVHKDPAPTREYPDVSPKAHGVPPHTGATDPVTSREAGQLTSGDRPGTPGGRHAGTLPLDGPTRRW